MKIKMKKKIKKKFLLEIYKFFKNKLLNNGLLS